MGVSGLGEWDGVFLVSSRSQNLNKEIVADRLFRFEAFDEPWKIIYDTPGKDWENKWGLMDPGRNIKPGLTIPDCGGKTAS